MNWIHLQATICAGVGFRNEFFFVRLQLPGILVQVLEGFHIFNNSHHNQFNPKGQTTFRFPNPSKMSLLS
eukprot:UN21525